MHVFREKTQFLKFTYLTTVPIILPRGACSLLSKVPLSVSNHVIPPHISTPDHLTSPVGSTFKTEKEPGIFLPIYSYHFHTSNHCLLIGLSKFPQDMFSCFAHVLQCLCLLYAPQTFQISWLTYSYNLSAKEAKAKGFAPLRLVCIASFRPTRAMQ